MSPGSSCERDCDGVSTRLSILSLMTRLHHTRHARWLHLSTTFKTRMIMLYKIYYAIQRFLKPSDRACSIQNVTNISGNGFSSETGRRVSNLEVLLEGVEVWWVLLVEGALGFCWTNYVFALISSQWQFKSSRRSAWALPQGIHVDLR